MVQQCAALLEHGDDVLVGVEDLLAGEQRRRRQEAAVVADGIVDGQPVLLADREVFLAVAGRGVHGAGAAVERDVLAEDDRHDAVVERVLQLQAFERRALDARELLRALQPCPREHGTARARSRARAPRPRHRRRAWHARASSRTPRAPRRPGWPAASTASSSRSRRSRSAGRCAVACRTAARAPPRRPTRNFTSIDGEVRSSYSTSASASAERQSRHQCTGL